MDHPLLGRPIQGRTPLLGRLARPWLVGRPCARATKSGSVWPLCRAGGQRSCRGPTAVCAEGALGQTPPRIAPGCARTAVLVHPRGRSPLRRPPRRRPPRGGGAFLYAPLFLLPAPCNRAGSFPCAAASALVRSKIVTGFRKATADALVGGDFEATGIRQLDDERIVGVWAAE